MEQRLIDANALLEVLEQRKRLCTGVYGDLGGAISGVIKLIDNAPTVEPRDNFDLGYVKGLEDGKPKQGEWIIVKDEKYGDNVKCPFCGKELAGTDLNFCCKCGADMRKGGAE